jgi:hypothetical protein
MVLTDDIKTKVSESNAVLQDGDTTSRCIPRWGYTVDVVSQDGDTTWCFGRAGNVSCLTPNLCFVHNEPSPSLLTPPDIYYKVLIVAGCEHTECCLACWNLATGRIEVRTLAARSRELFSPLIFGNRSSRSTHPRDTKPGTIKQTTSTHNGNMSRDADNP